MAEDEREAMRPLPLNIAKGGGSEEAGSTPPNTSVEKSQSSSFPPIEGIEALFVPGFIGESGEENPGAEDLTPMYGTSGVLAQVSNEPGAGSVESSPENTQLVPLPTLPVATPGAAIVTLSAQTHCPSGVDTNRSAERRQMQLPSTRNDTTNLGQEDLDLENCKKEKNELREAAISSVEDESAKQDLRAKDAKLKHLEKELKRVQEGYETQTIVISKLETKIKGLEEDLEKMETMQEAIDFLRHQIRGYKESVRENEGEIKELRFKLNHFEDPRMLRLRKEMEDDAQLLDEAREQRNIAQAETKRLEMVVQDNENIMGELEHEIKRLGKQLHDECLNINVLTTARNRLQGKSDTCEAEKAALRANIAQLNRRITTLGDSVQELNSQIQVLVAANEELTGLREQGMALAEDCLKQLLASDKRASELNSELDILKVERANQQSEITSYIKLVAEAQSDSRQHGEEDMAGPTAQDGIPGERRGGISLALSDEGRETLLQGGSSRRMRGTFTPPAQITLIETSPPATVGSHMTDDSRAFSSPLGYEGPMPVQASIDLAVLRCQAALQKMRDERAQHDFHRDDSMLAVKAAKDIWGASQLLPEGSDGESTNKEYYLAVGAYWQGIAHYYRNEVERARAWFIEAGGRDAEQYPAELIDAWLERIIRGGPKKAAAYYRDPRPVGNGEGKEKRKGKPSRRGSDKSKKREEDNDDDDNDDDCDHPGGFGFGSVLRSLYIMKADKKRPKVEPPKKDGSKRSITKGAKIQTATERITTERVIKEEEPAQQTRSTFSSYLLGVLTRSSSTKTEPQLKNKVSFRMSVADVSPTPISSSSTTQHTPLMREEIQQRLAFEGEELAKLQRQRETSSLFADDGAKTKQEPETQTHISTSGPSFASIRAEIHSLKPNEISPVTFKSEAKILA